MKFNMDKRKEELRNVPIEKRVWIYGAEIILEFLHATFMPTARFLKEPNKPATFEKLSKKDFLDDVIEEHKMRDTELYNLYVLYREQKGYTSPTESLFKFKVIIGKMRCYKNRWEFVKLRKGSDQNVYFSPLMLRSKATPEERSKYPVKPIRTEEGEVEMTMDDMQTPPAREPTPKEEIAKLDEPLITE